MLGACALAGCLGDGAACGLGPVSVAPPWPGDLSRPALAARFADALGVGPLRESTPGASPHAVGWLAGDGRIDGSVLTGEGLTFTTQALWTEADGSQAAGDLLRVAATLHPPSANWTIRQEGVVWSLEPPYHGLRLAYAGFALSIDPAGGAQSLHLPRQYLTDGLPPPMAEDALARETAVQARCAGLRGFHVETIGDPQLLAWDDGGMAVRPVSATVVGPCPGSPDARERARLLVDAANGAILEHIANDGCD
jgi:hypothetical protein